MEPISPGASPTAAFSKPNCPLSFKPKHLILASFKIAHVCEESTPLLMPTTLNELPGLKLAALKILLGVVSEPLPKRPLTAKPIQRNSLPSNRKQVCCSEA